MPSQTCCAKEDEEDGWLPLSVLPRNPKLAPMNSEHLWRRFKDGLRTFLRARLPSEADADDVLQEVFLRIHENADQVEHAGRVQGWVYTIARRCVADFYRARERRVLSDAGALEDTDQSVAADHEPSDHLSSYDGAHDVHEEVLSWLRPMIDALPEMYAVPLRMADVEGYTQQEIADALGLSLSGAKSRVQRGRARLGDLLRQCCAVEFGPEGRAVAFQRLDSDPGACQEAACG